MMKNVMMKTCLNQKIIKISNLIPAVKSSICPKPKVIRRPNFSESRICPYIYRMFRSVDWTHDMIIVKLREVTWSDRYSIFPKAEFARICPNIYRMFRSVDWTHDMIIARWHLFIWHVRKLCALTYAPPVQSTQTGQWLSTLFHANCSAAQVYVLYPRQFIFAPSCRRRPFLQVLQSTERQERYYFEKFFVYLMMTNVMVKTCLNQKIIKNSNLHDSGNEEERISESECYPKAEFFGKPNLSEYLPNVPKCQLNTRQDNHEATVIHLTRA